MRDNNEYKAYAQKMKMQGQTDFNEEMYYNMKKTQQQERVVREDQDPEIQAAFQKLNIDKLFMEFTARPIRSSVNEMAEDFLQMEHERKMSKRDKARKIFIANFKK